MKKVEIIGASLILGLMGIWQPLAAANVELTNIVGANKKKVIVPFAESGVPDDEKVGQQVKINIKVKSDFVGRVVIKNNSASSISLWKTTNGKTDQLTGDVEIPIAGTLQLGPLAELGCFYVKGKVEDENAKITAELYKGAEFKHKAEIHVAALAVGLREIAFSGDSNSHIPLAYDNGSNIPGSDQPKWIDGNGDGNPEVNQSMAYVRSSTPTIAPKIKLTNSATYTGTAKLSATGSGNADTVKFLEQSMKTDESNANAAMLSTSPVAAGNWRNIIQFYGKSSPTTPTSRPAFELTWKIKIDGGYEVKFAKSNHQVYVTAAYPTLVKNRESLFYYACHRPHLQSGDDGKSVTSAIYVDFETKAMQKIHPISGELHGPHLKFYPVDNNHILVNGSGKCGAWAQFFIEVLRVHGYQNQVSSIGVNGKDIKFKDGELHAGSGWIPKGNPKLILHKCNTGQGNGTGGPSSTSWQTHEIVKAFDDYYDPSYGIGPPPNDDADISVEFENNAVGWYFYEISKFNDTFPVFEERIFNGPKQLNYTPTNNY